jgi:hypothetical protein
MSLDSILLRENLPVEIQHITHSKISKVIIGISDYTTPFAQLVHMVAAVFRKH